MGKVKSAGKVKKKKASAKSGAAGAKKAAKEGATAKAPEAKPAAKPYTRPEIFSKPRDLQTLFAPFKEVEISGEILRPRLQTESVEHGRGYGQLRNFAFRKFKEEAKAVVFMNAPSSKGGGSFEPTDRLLTPGEQIRITFSAIPDGAEGPVYFLGKGFFLRKSFLIPADPNNGDKPWTGTREEAAAKFGKDLVVGGDDIIEVRIDTVNSFPGGPGRTDRGILERYLRESRLMIFPGGGGWAQKSTQGNFFDSIRDPLEKYVERDDLRVHEKVIIDEFTNEGEVVLMVKQQLLSEVEHDVARPAVVKKPTDFLGEVNAKLGFLLYFKMDEGIAESLARSFPKKAGKEDEVYMPLILEDVAAAREQFRVTFRVFPRDLIEERSRKSMERGLKFQPPYALHQGPENQTTFSKLLILLNQRFREDEKPEEDKLKSEKLKASVDKRISERRGAFVDEKVKSQFQERVSAKKRKEEGG